MKRARGAERKPLVMSEAGREVCWRKGSKGLLLGAGGTAAAVAERGKGAACRHTMNKKLLSGERSLHEAFALAGQEGPSILHALFFSQPRARPGAQMSF